ncbi:MAG: hypothetical protein ACR2NU_09205 [Aeoliella sp.]
MESHARMITIASLALLAVGCEASVELDPVPVAPTTMAIEEAAPDDSLPPADEEPSVVGIEDFKKGKQLRESEYQTTRAFAVRFTVEQKYILINKDRALQLYQAEHGEYPESHEDFMEKIIRPNNIKLPELEPGYEYLYKPEDPMNLYKQRAGANNEAE